MSRQPLHHRLSALNAWGKLPVPSTPQERAAWKRARRASGANPSSYARANCQGALVRRPGPFLGYQVCYETPARLADRFYRGVRMRTLKAARLARKRERKRARKAGR